MFGKFTIIGLVLLLLPAPPASAGTAAAPELTDPTGDVATPMTPAALLGPVDSTDLVAAWLDSESDIMLAFNFQVASLDGAEQGNQETQRKLYFKWHVVSTAAPDWSLDAETWLRPDGTWEYVFTVDTGVRKFGYLAEGEVLKDEGVIRLLVPRPLMGDPRAGDQLKDMIVTSQAGPFSDRNPDCNKDYCDTMSGPGTFTFQKTTMTGVVFDPAEPRLRAAPGEEMSFRIDALYEGLLGRLIEAEDAKLNVSVLDRPAGWPVQLTPDSLELGPGENGTVVLRTIAPKSTPSGQYTIQMSFREDRRESLLNLTVDLLKPGEKPKPNPTQPLAGGEDPAPEKDSPGLSLLLVVALLGVALRMRRD